MTPREPYIIVDVDAEMAGGSEARLEPVGTRSKFWYERPDGARWLLKFARENTGEDWSERIAARLAERLNLSHADVELASYQERRAVVVRDFTDAGRESLVHGNELLAEGDPRYAADNHRRLSEHAVAPIVAALEKLYGLEPDDEYLPGIYSGVDLFLGYLMLDALIVNTDRHHQNWAVLTFLKLGEQRWDVLAPTYDHASSLGRELTDAARERKFRCPDGSFDVAKYVAKARTPIFRTPTDARPMSPLAVFRAFAALRPRAARAWLDVLSDTPQADFDAAVDAVPEERMSQAQKAFARSLLTHTKMLLLEPSRD